MIETLDELFFASKQAAGPTVLVRHAKTLRGRRHWPIVRGAGAQWGFELREPTCHAGCRKHDSARQHRLMRSLPKRAANVDS